MDVWREIVEEERKYFENYRDYAKTVKEVTEKILGDVRVIVFGSVVEGKHTPASDIDVLVWSKNMPESMGERSRIAAEIFRKIGVNSPFEIHLVNEKEFEWYMRFIKVYEEV